MAFHNSDLPHTSYSTSTISMLQLRKAEVYSVPVSIQPMLRCTSLEFSSSRYLNTPVAPRSRMIMLVLLLPRPKQGLRSCRTNCACINCAVANLIDILLPPNPFMPSPEVLAGQDLAFAQSTAETVEDSPLYHCEQ